MGNYGIQHIPVMSDEVVFYLNPSSKNTIVDCTLGSGGHAEKIKKQNTKIKIIGIDRDAEALKKAKEKLAKFENIEFIHENFAHLKKIINKKVDGFLFDLGLSSDQIGNSTRGFSYQTDGPLDMRMDQRQKLTAAEIVNYYPSERLLKILKTFGEERHSRKICQAIISARSKRNIKTTLELKEIIEKAIPTWRKRESLARVFQALRIEVNKELDNLKIALEDAIDLLKAKGRIVVISYHSLEDRIVKQTFRAFAQKGEIKILTKKPITPSKEEIAANPRAKSAKLRAAEKLK